MAGCLPSDFIVGANLPWVSYGGDFGANLWRPEGGIARPPACAAARRLLREIADTGARSARWFMVTDGRAGLRVDADGRLLGLDDRFLADFDQAVELLRETGLRAIFVLFDFTWCSPPRTVNGVRLGARSRWLARQADRRRLLDLVVAPILGRHARDPAILGWDVMNEPEWATTRRPWPFRGHRVSRRVIRAFIGEVAALVHSTTSHMATVGSASARSLPLVAGLGLDFYQVHWYDRQTLPFDLGRPVDCLGLERPVLLGEFPTRASALAPRAIVAAARASGYAGALGWSMAADDEASDRSALLTAMLNGDAGGNRPSRATAIE